MTIILLFQLNGCRCFKCYYQGYVCLHLSGFFPAPVRYHRFVELTRYALLPQLIYTQLFRQGKPTGVSFIDSTPLNVCHNLSIYSHKVFKTCAARGKSSIGWFYGFKFTYGGEICSL